MSDALQIKGISVDKAFQQIQDTTSILQNKRCDNHFQEIATQAEAYARDVHIPTEFETCRDRRRPPMPGELARDECLTGRTKFKINTFFGTADTC